MELFYNGKRKNVKERKRQNFKKSEKVSSPIPHSPGINRFLTVLSPHPNTERVWLEYEYSNYVSGRTKPAAPRYFGYGYAG